MMADIRMLQEQTQQLQNLLGVAHRRSATRQGASTPASTSRPSTTRKAFADQKLVDRQRWRTTCAWSARRSTTTTCASASLTQEVDALRAVVQQLNVAARAVAAAHDAGRCRRRRPEPAHPAAAAPTAGARRRLGRHVAAQAVRHGATPTTRPASTISPSIGFEAYISDVSRSPSRPTTRRCYIGALVPATTARTTRPSKPYDTGDPHLSRRSDAVPRRTTGRAWRSRTCKQADARARRSSTSSRRIPDSAAATLARSSGSKDVASDLTRVEASTESDGDGRRLRRLSL